MIYLLAGLVIALLVALLVTVYVAASMLHRSHQETMRAVYARSGVDYEQMRQIERVGDAKVASITDPGRAPATPPEPETVAHGLGGNP